jgi:DNA-directed RNA polymerase
MAEHDMMALQATLEALSTEMGVERYRKHRDRLINDNQPEGTVEHSRLIKGALPRVAEYISNVVEEGSGPKSVLQRQVMSELNADLLAYIGLAAAFRGVYRRWPISYVTLEIGKQVELEVWARGFKSYDPKAFKRITDRATRAHSSVKIRRKAVKIVGAKAGYKVDPWSNQTKTQIGAAVLNAVLFASRIFAMTSVNGQKAIGFTDEAEGRIADLVERADWAIPVFLPMIVPPRAWTNFSTGAYRTKELAKRTPLVRTTERETKTIVNRAIRDGSMRPCLAALNAIQGTPYSINGEVLDAVKWAFGECVRLDKFPLAERLPALEFPPDFDDLNDHEKKGWRLKARKIHDQNRGIDSDRAVFHLDMKVADEMAKYPSFWLPHNLDFRGRVYPVPHFSHQRSDHVKALFEFARGVPLGEDGGYWLAIHLANCGDFEKVSKRGFGDRIDWVLEHREEILKVAEDWKTHRWWLKADKPFQFLAACLDWAGYEAQGAAWVSHLPVAFDGSNSGLQHYSAALRSRLDGSQVNLTVGEAPSDIYQAVADYVKREVEKDAGEDPMAALWLDYGITRKVVKRAVMTFAYSSEQYGFKMQLMSDLMNPLASDVLRGDLEEHPFGEDGGFIAAGYLAKKIWEAVQVLISAASDGMSFFKQVAGVLAHEAKPLVWKTPVGFPVLHMYRAWDTQRVVMYLYDHSLPPSSAGKGDRVDANGNVFRRVVPTVRALPTNGIKKSKAKSAVSPNVIHSFDAAHLMRTVLKAKSEGIEDYMLIHDSFGAHAGHAERWFQIIREAFVEMYTEHDPFEVIYESATAALSPEGQKKMPNLPKRGDLKLDEVLSSLYAFA